MMRQARVLFLLMAASFFVAFILSIVPLPSAVEWYRPAWVALVLIYWAMFMPQHIGVVSAWILGLLLDLLLNTVPLGEHALALAIVAYLAIRLSHRVKLFPLWQQAFVVLLLVGIYHLIVLWVQGLTGNVPQTWFYWAGAISSVLIWPFINIILRRSERYWLVLRRKR